MKHVLELDNEETWPRSLVDLFAKWLPALNTYEEHREELDQRAARDVKRQMKRPENLCQRVYDEVITACKRAVDTASILGFHCTRLHPDEIADVRRQGLRPLTAEVLTERIQTLVAKGEIPVELAPRLLTTDNADDANQKGRIWFTFNRDALREEHGIGCFFKYWGGDAFFNFLDRGEAMGPILRQFGTPCIVEAAVPMSKLDSPLLEQKLYGAYMHRRGTRTEWGADADGCLDVPLPADCIRRVVTPAHTDFRRMTECDSWEMPL